MNTIATWNIHRMIWNDAVNVQNQLTTAQLQEASGLKALDFATLGASNTQTMISLQAEIAQSQTWATNASNISNTMQAMFDSVGSISTNLGKLQAQISGALASPEPTQFLPTIRAIYANIVESMNTKVGTNFIFSGTQGNIPPVNLNNYPTLNSSSPYYTGTSADTSYYQGNSNIASLRVTQQLTVNYGVPANNSAFEQTLRAAKTAIEALSSGTVNSSSVTGTATFSSTSSPLTLIGGFSVNGGGNVSILPTDSLDDIVTKINNAAGSSGIAASISGTGPYSLTLSGTGSSLTFNNQSETALSSLGISPTLQKAADISSALQLSLTTAANALVANTTLQQSISANSQQIQDFSQIQTTFSTYLINSLVSTKDANTGQVAADVNQYQTQLQASYMAITSLTKMNLVQYL
jgi:flagellar hook-associated protein 3 FlgL